MKTLLLLTTIMMGGCTIDTVGYYPSPSRYDRVYPTHTFQYHTYPTYRSTAPAWRAPTYAAPITPTYRCYPRWNPYP